MKILFTVEFYFPHLGGAESVVQQVAESMARKGHHVVVATSTCPERKFRVLNNVHIQQFDIKGNLVKGIRGETEKYEAYISNTNFDVLVNYAAQTWSTDLTFKMLDSIAAKKVLIPCGYSGLSILSKKIPYYLYFKRLHQYLKKYQHIVYHAEDGKDKHYGEKYQLSSYTTIPNGVFLEEFKTDDSDFKKKYGINTKHLLVSIGNHYRIKNHAFMIRAVNKICNKDFTFVIIGRENKDGLGCFSRCKKLEKKLGGKLRLFHNLSRKDTVAGLLQADLLLFSSKFEYFPIVLLEAMAAKTPFVSTDVGNAKALAGGVVVNSDKDMSIAIDNLLGDPERMRELGRSGYEQCKRSYTWPSIFKRYEALFENLAT